MANLDKKLIRQYNRLLPKWEKAHARYWQQNASRPYVTVSGVSTADLSQQARMTPKAKTGPYGGPDIRRKRAEEYSSNRALRAAIESMRRETSPGFRRRRLENQKKWMLRRLEAFQDEELLAFAEELSLDQIEQLYDFGDFGQILNSSVDIINSDPTMALDPVEEEAMRDTLRQRIDEVLGELSPYRRRRAERKTRKARRKAEKARKRAEYMAEEPARRQQTRDYNARMASKGREWLERYGVKDTFGPEASMTREEWIASYSSYWS